MTWVLSITSIAMLWLMGNRSVAGPIVGIMNQFLWIGYVIHTEQWGLLLGTFVFLIVHIRNLLKWRSDGKT